MRVTFVGGLDLRGSSVFVHVLSCNLTLLCPPVLGVLVLVCCGGHFLRFFPALVCDLIQDDVADVLLGHVLLVEEDEIE